VSDVVRRYLERADYEVTLAADGPERADRRQRPGGRTWSCST
jgi:hypothetical protein